MDVHRIGFKSLAIESQLAGLFLLAAGVLTSQRAAAADGDGGTVQRLGEITVQAEPAADPVLDPLTVAPSQELTLDIVDQREIEYQRPRTAVDALNFVPSLEVRRKGRKNPISLSIRGEGNTTVLFDGMNAQARGDYRFVDYLPASLIKEIRVIRDSTSLMYGPPQLTSSNGTMGYGGIVDFRLREPPTEKTTGEFRAELARFQENIEHLHVAGPLSDRAGYIVSVDNNYTSGPGGENMGHDFRNFMGRVKVRYAGESTLTLTAMLERGWRELQKAESYSFYSDFLQEFDPWKTNTLMLRINHVWTEDVSTTIDAFYRYHEATLYDYKLGGLQYDTRDSKRGINIRQTIRTAERNTLRFGGQVGYWNNPTGMLNYGLWTTNQAGNPVIMAYPRREIDYSWYVQDSFIAIPDRLTLDAGLRWDRKYIYKGFTANGPAFKVKTNGGLPVEDQWQDPALSYALGARYQLTPSQAVTARVAVATESTSTDFVDRNGGALPNVQETRGELGYQTRVNPSLTLGLNGFWKKIDNGLRYAGRYDANPAPGPANVTWVPYWDTTDYQRAGIEMKAKGALGEDFDYFLNCTLMNGVNKTLKEHDEKTPRLTASGGLRYHRGPWRGALSVKEVSGYKDDFGTNPPANPVEIHVGNYTLVDINVGYIIEHGRFTHEIYCGVRNLANQHYETVPGWKDPGRSAFVGYSLKF